MIVHEQSPEQQLQKAIFYCHGGMIKPATMTLGGFTSKYITQTEAREQLFKNLGIPYGKGHRIPLTMEGDYQYDGLRFKLFKSSSLTCNPTPAEIRRGDFANRAHRLYLHCPACPDGRLIPVGRLGQHASVHIASYGETATPHNDTGLVTSVNDS